MNIREILNKIQTELHAPKGQVNNFGNYKYRSCEDILEALKPLLKETGASLVISDEIIQIGDRYYVKALAILTHPECEVSLQSSAFAREPENKKGMDEAQITGATSSYARKYALNGLFCIDDTKDADTMDNRDNASKNSDSVRKNPTVDSDVKKEVLAVAQEKLKTPLMFQAWREKRGFPSKLADCSEAHLSQILEILTNG